MVNTVYVGNGTYYGGGGKYYSGQFAEDGITETISTWAGSSVTFTYVTRSVTGQDGNFTASLQLSESTYRIGYKSEISFSIPLPTITAAFTVAPGAGPAPVLETFTDTSTYHVGQGTLIYLWQYGSGSLTSIVATAPALTYQNAGGYTASLQVTESRLGVASNYTQSFVVA